MALIVGFAPALLRVWVGPQFEPLSLVLGLIVFPLCVYIAVTPLFTIQIAYNRVRVPAFVSFATGFANLALALWWVGLGRLGLGVALASAAALAFRFVIFTPYYSARIQSLPWYTYYPALLTIIGSATGTALAARLLSQYWVLNGWLALLAACIAVGLVYVALVYLVGLSAAEKLEVRSLLSALYEAVRLAIARREAGLMETHPENLARNGPTADAQSQTKRFVWPLAIVTVLMFNQIWWDAGGFTFRFIDLVMLALLGIYLFQALHTGRLRYAHSSLNGPLLLWLGVLLLGALVTQFRPVLAVNQQDAIVNSVRLALAISLFLRRLRQPCSLGHGQDAHRFLHRHRLQLRDDTRFATTNRSLGRPPAIQSAGGAGHVQRGRKSGAGPGNLCPVCRQQRHARLVGDAGLAGALCLDSDDDTTRSVLWRLAGYGYCVVLGLILVRTSVRNSILGLVVAVVFLSLLRAFKSRYVSTRLIVPALIVGGALLGALALLTFAPEQYFVQRLVQTIPRLTGQEIVIDRASNIFGRLEYAQVGVKIFQRYPLLGGGFYGYRTYYLDMTRHDHQPHHNSYVQTMAELGLVGLLSPGWPGAFSAFWLSPGARFCSKLSGNAGRGIWPPLWPCSWRSRPASPIPFGSQRRWVFS